MMVGNGSHGQYRWEYHGAIRLSLENLMGDLAVAETMSESNVLEAKPRGWFFRISGGRTFDREMAFSVFSMTFCACLVISNVLAAKVLDLGPFSLPGSIILFPVVYIINDVLSEIYGFQRARLVIMMGFCCAALASFCFTAAIALPGMDANVSAGFKTVLGTSWRFFLACLCSYCTGSLVNSWVMVSMKKHNERALFARCMVSTLAGDTCDSTIFITIAFAGTLAPSVIALMVGSQVLFKVSYEAILYPVTRQVIMRMRKLPVPEAVMGRLP